MRKCTWIPALAGVLLAGLLAGPALQADDEFLRGDANQDGTVSLADEVTIQRFLFAGQQPLGCYDSMDVDDSGNVNMTDEIAVLWLLHHPWKDGWNESLAAPYPSVGSDPSEDDLDCCSYVPVAAEASSSEIVELGQVEGAPGETVHIPIFLTNTVEIDGLQLVLEYDPEVLTPVVAPNSLILGPYYDQFGEDHFNPLQMMNSHPEEGILTIALVGTIAYPDFEIVPGEDHLVAYIPVTVSLGAAPGTVVEISGTNGPDDAGVGPHMMRNEAIHHGEARYISVIPRVESAILQIVGDLTFFRGDSNRDEAVDLADVQYTLNYLFGGRESPALSCMDAADANDDGDLNIADPITTLIYLFSGGSTLPPPHPDEGRDPTSDELTCAVIAD